ncbi:MAG: HEAT repeat domain-containing protein [Fidelibacterota bacterium]|nr:MAG: HEAT repeat domain-containing protein [Candidatus Neomarinimicrobiota bacterium]
MKRTRSTKPCVLVLLAATLLAVSYLNGQDHGFSDDRATLHGTRDRDYDLKHIKLDLTFNHAEKSVMGTATTTLTPINDNFDRVVLDAVDLAITSVSVATDVTIEEAPTRGSQPVAFTLADDHLIVDLDKAYASGDLITLEIAYSAHPRLGLYFVQPDSAYPNKPWQIWSQGEMEENRHWFPGYDFPNDQMTSEMIATVPEGNLVISNGELLNITRNQEAGTVTYHWRESIPHVNYLISIIAGEFAEVRDEWEGIPLQYFVEPKYIDLVERSFAKTSDMMSFYSETIGIKYPYEKYAQTSIADFMWGGMENVSATTLTEYTLHDERAHLDFSSDGLVAHELAHQWWGNLLTTKNWNHIWLNEGFATYFEALYTEHDQGYRAFTLEMDENRQYYMKEDSKEYRRPIVTSWYENPEELFDRHSYQKGSLVLHMIRTLLGEDLWWKSIRHYARTYAGHTVETNDFKQAIEDATGRSMDWFFDQWVYHGGHPEYEVSWTWDRKQQAVALEVRQVQEIDDVTPLFRMPIEISVTGDFGTERFTIQVNQKEETFHLPLLEKPRRVEFDPKDHVLKTLHFTKSKKEILDQLANAGDHSRMRAARWLADYPDGKVTKALGSALRYDPFRGVRTAAARSLGSIRTKAARDSLLANVRAEHPRVRRAVVAALGEYVGDKKIAAALEDVFRNDSSYYTQAEAVMGIAKLATTTAYDVCVEALEMPSHKNVIRTGALYGLSELGDPRGVDHALAWAEYGRPPEVRAKAITALAKLALVNPDQRKKIENTLVSLLEDPHFYVRYSAMEALGKLGNPALIPSLETSLSREVHFRLQDAARDAIRRIGRTGTD